MDLKNVQKILRRVAKVWSIFSVAFVLLFLIGYALDSSEPAPDLVELLLMAFFPFGVIIGMLVAWKCDRCGSFISVISLVAFYIGIFVESGKLVRGPYVILVAVPGFLFMLSWIFGRKITKNKKGN